VCCFIDKNESKNINGSYYMKTNNLFEKLLDKSAYILEMTVAGLLVIGIVFGMVEVFSYLQLLLTSSTEGTYEIFQSFLGYSLLLIVGIELILMILYHSNKALLELILFVIARKMLVYSHSMLDLIFGTLAIAIVFFIVRYLVPRGEDDILRSEDHSYHASSYAEDIFSKMGINMLAPSHRDIQLGDLVSRLAEKESKPVEEGAEFHIDGISFIIMKTTENGEVEEVRITDDNKYEKGEFERYDKKT